MGMGIVEALKYLRDNPKGIMYEWTSAGLWQEVCKMLEQHESGKESWTCQELDSMIVEANAN